MSAVKTVTATINGTAYTLTYNSSTEAYEASVTAPTKSSYNQSGHYYNVSVSATDVAGNAKSVDASDSTYGSALRLVVMEKVKPIITFNSPTSGAGLTNNKPTISLSVTDADAGVNLSTLVIQIDSGTVIKSSACTTASITNGYLITYTPSTALTDGSHTITAYIDDNDGNRSATASITIKVDTVPPTLTVASPTDSSYTNNTACTVSGITNDAASSPVTVAITVRGTDVGTVTLGSDGKFSKAVTLTEGVNSIVISSTDSLGKVTTVTRTVTLDTTAPEFSSITVSPNPVDAGKTYTISVKVS